MHLYRSYESNAPYQKKKHRVLYYFNRYSSFMILPDCYCTDLACCQVFTALHCMLCDCLVFFTCCNALVLSYAESRFGPGPPLTSAFMCN